MNLLNTVGPLLGIIAVGLGALLVVLRKLRHNATCLQTAPIRRNPLQRNGKAIRGLLAPMTDGSRCALPLWPRTGAAVVAVFLAMATNPAACADIVVQYDSTVEDDMFDVISKAGLSEADVQALVHDATSATPNENTSAAPETKVLSGQLGVPESVVSTFFLVLGEQQVPPDQLLAKLAAIAGNHREMLQWIAEANVDGPGVQSLWDEAIAAIKSGQYAAAEPALGEAEKASLAAANDTAKNSASATVKLTLSAAAIRATRGELNLTQLRYQDAVDDLRVANEIASGTNRRSQQLKYLLRYAHALQIQVREKGDEGRLEDLIAAYRESLTLLDLVRKDVPSTWATVQHQLGTALMDLGQRQGRTDLLEQAVSTLELAEEERTRERVPLDWAKTEGNLGSVLLVLGERRHSRSLVEQAVAKHEAALSVFAAAGADRQADRARANLDLAKKVLISMPGG